MPFVIYMTGKYDIGNVEKNFRSLRHWLATISFDGVAAFRNCISGLVFVSGRLHFEIGKSENKSNYNPYNSE